MDAISIAEPKCSYSWWWDSHISPKNSKWLQDNLTDMDNKIKAMILLIEEDADSFARRAEMYYKKRPDLMKLVEEFYRAYRALVERYDHVTGALRQAHRTIAVAFPNQLQSTVPDEPPSGLLDTGDEPTYETGTQTMPKFMQWDAESLNWLFTDEDLKKNLDLKNNGANLSEFKKLEEEVLGMSNENKNLKKEIAMESLRAEKAESELQCQKNAIFKLKSELESAYQRYQISEGRISDLESELSVSQAHCLHLNDEISIKASKLSITEDQCLGLEREKTCLQSEIDKCKLIVSKQHEEALNLLKENQNFQNQINSESKRADTAEVDSTRLRDTILRLKSELESTLLQYRFSQGRISDLEAEISHTKEQLKNINHEMVRHASKLNLAEDQCQLLLEENKTLQHELEIALKKITSQDKEIIMKDEELNFLKQSVEFECQRRTQAEITEKALLTKVNNLEQRVENQEEEIRRGAEKLRQLELRKAGLEEEIKHILDENNGLNEENFLSVSKIICLQDEINSLMASKHKIQDELRFKTEAVMFLQQELSSYKSSRNELEEGRHELMVKLKRMELRDATIEEEMRSLHDENIGLYEKYFSFSSKIVNLQDDIICLKESSYKLEDELQFHLEEKNTLQNEKFVLEERHHRLKEHVEEVNRNVTSLQAVVKELLDGNKELRDEKACHLMLMEIMAEKNVFLENSLSDSNAELKILFEKIKGLEEYSEFLHENVHKFISSEPVLISHSDVMLSGNYSVMGSSITDLNVEFDVLRGKVKALEEPCQSLYYQNSHLITQNSKLVSQVEKVGLHLQNLENRFVILEEKQVNEEKDLALYHIRELDGKEEHDNHLCFFRNLLSDLSNQIYLLKSKNQTTKEELEEEHLRSVKGEIDSFIMKLFLVDLNEANQFLSNKCQKYVDKLEEVKIAVFELKQEWNDKLLEGLHAMMNKYDMKKARLEKPFPFTLLEQLALILAEHRTQKKDLEQESLLRNKEISILHTKNQELMEINEQSRKREETLSFKTETICGRVFELQEACQASQLEISKLLEEIKSLSVKLQKLRDQNEALEEENDTLLEEAMTQEHLCLIFKNFNSEKTSDIDWLIRDVTCLYRITGQLDQEIRVINKNMRALEEENMQLKEEYRAHVVILENKIHLSRSALRRHNKEAERMNKFVEIQSSEPPLNPELEIESLQKSNKMLEVELETVGMKLKNTTSELQMSIEECGFYKAESAKLQHELQTSSIMEFICKAKLFELTQSVSQINIPFEEELKDRVEELGRENKGLKAELNALAPVVVSLEKEITSLEEHTLSLTNLHILNSKRKQGNILASLQHKKSSQARGKHQSPRASVVIMDLKKLRAKVKVLQKEVTDTEGLLEQGKVTSCTTETRKNRACKSSGPPRKQDIILDLKKSDNICKDIELDHVLSSSHREEGDRARILWDDIETSENPSSELTLEKELSVDNSVLLISYNESLQKWMDRVSKSISADAQRLFALEKSLDELKMKLLTTEMKSQADYAVKETEEALIKVTEFNQKLAKMAESFSLSSDSSKLRRRVLERVQRGAEKIDGLELKLQKVQCIVLKLQEEHLESKVAKPEERRSKLPLKDLIYGNQSNPKQMKRRFCGCMRFKKKEK